MSSGLICCSVFLILARAACTASPNSLFLRTSLEALIDSRALTTKTVELSGIERVLHGENRREHGCQHQQQHDAGGDDGQFRTPERIENVVVNGAGDEAAVLARALLLDLFGTFPTRVTWTPERSDEALHLHHAAIGRALLAAEARL